MRGAVCFTDHILLRCKASFQLACRHRRQPSSSIKKKLDVNKLSNPRNVEALQEALAVSLEVTPPTNCPEESWSALRNTVYNTASDILGHPKRKHQDWFDENDEEILLLLKETREAKAALLSDQSSVSKHEHFKRLGRESQEKIRHIKDSWWNAKTEELQHYADQHASKQFFEGLRTLYGPPSSTVTPIRDSEGNLLKQRHRS